MTTPAEFKQLISQLQVDLTPAEFHGFISGLVVGGVQDDSWKTLTYQFTNDGHAFSQAPLKTLENFYQELTASYHDANTLFSLWLPEDENDGFALADGIAEWTSHFILGLGLAQPKLNEEKDEVGEAIDDLEEISRLGYHDDDKNEELIEAGEEVVEYLRVLALFLHSNFALNSAPAHNKTQLH